MNVKDCSDEDLWKLVESILSTRELMRMWEEVNKRKMKPEDFPEFTFFLKRLIQQARREILKRKDVEAGRVPFPNFSSH